MNHDAIILFAHGARDPRWAAPFEAVAEHVRSERPGVAVRLAFLELMTPDLPAAAAELIGVGCRRIEVVPLFLGTGGHVRKDLPALLDALRGAHPQIGITLHPAVGDAPEVIVAMAAAAARTVPRP
jgi:sirohydrochlorin cobaltochelatase